MSFPKNEQNPLDDTWYSCGHLKYLKMTRKTNRLSMDREYSMETRPYRLEMASKDARHRFDCV